MQVPFLDLKAQHAALEAELTEAFRAIVRGAAFVGGPEVEAFEREFAAFCHADGAVGVGSGTDALRFAYLAMRIKPGDEVITVPNSFIATTEALTQAGAAVRFVDVLPDTLLMDPTELAAAITPRTVGIVPVHLYGTPADMEPIQEIARAHGLWVIEDAAQAHGAVYKGRRAGTMGAMAAFSFYPGKNLSACGEAGAVTSSDAGRLEFVRKLRQRDWVRECWQGRGIATGLHYPLPLHQQVAYRYLHLANGAFPVTEQAAGEILSLPMYPEMRADQVDYVSETLIECFAGRSSRSAPRVMAQLTPA